ncbi:response regulator receiver modulated diguanylate cyclase [Pseudomonas sp. M47T1]|uniref:GGDEF domain-containing protein n=1 Tax=unclassified Pseudomonas TaxID=196821 RepID=UPI00026077F4|nr:diguanylate cyclase [Pseudomonas sp. M47T1]EIK98057.1 response regulator receiver modulated diguanylate cyclase [Pseudomonas sp. M47T1]
MPNPNLSIVLVQDDPERAATLTTLLHHAGCQDVRYCTHADALARQEQQPASLMLLEGEPGLALASRVRQFDEMGEHYTYILLISERNASELLDDTADLGIDDVIAPNALAELLPARLHAAERLYNIVQRLRQENSLLRQNIASLEQRNLVDSLTGLGNARYLRQKLTDSLRQIQARGGALCYLLIGLQNADQLQREHGTDRYDELLQGVARRLQQMVRPLDVLGRLDDQHFVLLTLPADLQECAPSSFKRLHDGLNLKAFMTSSGAIDVVAGISLIGADGKSLPQTPQALFDEARALLGQSYDSGLVSAKRLPVRG